jgi:Protein of unknown function (DUF2764)
MADFYYLLSSLPMLRPNQGVPMSTAQFMTTCGTHLSPGEMQTLAAISSSPAEESHFKENSVPARWNIFETCMRNRIIDSRPAKNTESAQYMRVEKDYFSAIERGVQEAFSRDNPLEREKRLDAVRLEFLDDLDGAHFFDFDALCVYKLKLMLLEKQARWDQAHGTTNFDAVIIAASTVNTDDNANN